MAYSNWGGKVFVDNKPLHGNCDNTPCRVDRGMRGFGTAYLLHFEDQPESIWEEMFHAIVGDTRAGILVCLYKNTIAHVFVKSEEREEEGLKPWYVRRPPEPCKDNGTEFPPLEVSGITINWYKSTDPNRVVVWFVDSLGRQWRGEAGYEMGEGYELWS